MCKGSTNMKPIEKWIFTLSQFWTRVVVFLDHFKEMPHFQMWFKHLVVAIIKDGEPIEKNMMHMSMPPMFEARSYWTMWMFGKHIRDSSVENHLITCDSMCSDNLWMTMCFKAKWPKTRSCKIM